MLEILALIHLCRKNGGIAEKKGYQPGRYKFLTVLFWFGGEILGGIIGGILAGADGGALIYVLALMGAVSGAGLSRLVVNKLPSLTVVPTQVFD